MSWGFWKTMLRPDKEELQNPEKTAVVRAANILQIGEFQLLQLSYREWHGEDLPVEQIDQLFHAYMLDGVVPHWARHYTRQVLALSEAGRLDDNAAHYHRFDHDYRSEAPNGLRKFVIAVSCLVLFVGGSILLADATTKRAVSMFPPYFEDDNSKRIAPVQDGFGRADSIHPRPGP